MSAFEHFWNLSGLQAALARGVWLSCGLYLRARCDLRNRVTLTTGCPTRVFDGTSCDNFLDGCYAPDTTGTCTDGDTKLSWTDGHEIVRTGDEPGLYGPSDGAPCIALVFDGAAKPATLTNVATNEPIAQSTTSPMAPF